MYIHKTWKDLTLTAKLLINILKLHFGLECSEDIKGSLRSKCFRLQKSIVV